MLVHTHVMAQMMQIVEVTGERLAVFGNASGGEYAAEAGLDLAGRASINDSTASPLAQRAKKAERLAVGLAALAEGQLPAGV